jgi:hypothetical protein
MLILTGIAALGSIFSGMNAIYAALTFHTGSRAVVDATQPRVERQTVPRIPIRVLIYSTISVLLFMATIFLGSERHYLPGPVGPQGAQGPAGSPGQPPQFTEFDRKFARKLFLEKELPTLQAAASEFGKKVGQFVDQSIRCSSNSSMAQAESCRIFAESTKFTEDDTIRFLRNDLNMVISPDDVCGRDMSDPYPEEDQMNISSPKKYEYRVRAARFHCAEQTISKILINMQKDIDSATSYINGIGRESYVAK